MHTHRSHAVRAATAALALSGFVACSKGSNPAGASMPPPAPPPAPVTAVVRQSSFTGLDPNFILVIPFAINTRGDLEVLVDWTFATNDLDLFLASGTNPCSTGGGIDFRTCTIVASETSPTAEPERMRVGSVAAGSYTLYIPNLGPGAESLSYQILLTFTPGAAEPPGAGLSATGGGAAVQVRRAAPGTGKP